MPTSFQDYYATLGISKDATEKQIKSAFRKIARESHPDTHPGDAAAEHRFRSANEAYEVLRDPKKRKMYDQMGPRWQEYEQWEKAGGQGANPFQQFGGAQYRTVSPDEFQQMFGGGGFSDFFQTFFGDAGNGRGTRGRAAPMPAMRGEDFETETEVSFAEAFRGTVRTIELNENGTTRRVQITIPPGIRDGARVRARGQAGRGTHLAAHGDLYVRVHVRPDPRFRRDSDDVNVTVEVPLAIAIAGGSVTVPTPSGKNLSLTIPRSRGGR